MARLTLLQEIRRDSYLGMGPGESRDRAYEAGILHGLKLGRRLARAQTKLLTDLSASEPHRFHQSVGAAMVADRIGRAIKRRKTS